MTTDLVVHQEHQLTAAQIRANVNLVQQVMAAVMKEGTHYGKIPGTPKPSLWKPGAEVLAATFRIAVSYDVEDLSTVDSIRYRVRATGTHQTTGIVMGQGMGECSTGEAKYKWREAASRREFEATPEDRRRIRYGYKNNRDFETMQVRTEPADLANTVLKMACKRAQVAMTLNATAASDIFTQDIEDLPEELRGHETEDEMQTPPLADDIFAEQRAGWEKAIRANRKSVDELVSWVAARGAALTPDQLAIIKSWMPAANGATPGAQDKEAA